MSSIAGGSSEILQPQKDEKGISHSGSKGLDENRPFTAPESVEKVKHPASLSFAEAGRNEFDEVKENQKAFNTPVQAEQALIGQSKAAPIVSDELGTGYEEDSEASSAA